MDPLFYLKDGSLTRYALSCGYVEKKGFAQLYRELECYHVLAWNGEVQVWKSTYSLTEARKLLRQLAKIAKERPI